MLTLRNYTKDEKQKNAFLPNNDIYEKDYKV